jgi:predicted methyltransferase
VTSSIASFIVEGGLLKKLASLLVALLSACASSPQPATSSSSSSPSTPASSAAAPRLDPAQIVAAPDRDEADRALDPGRKPAALLAFLGVEPGMNVGEIGAGGGYTTELLARAVGPHGRVYAQNAPMILEKFAAGPWAARLAKPVNANVVRLDRELDDPFGPDVKDLDVVVNVLFYHDTVWIGTDRDKMNKAVLDALKPGGLYVIVDHAAKPGAGTSEVQTLHRIDEQTVKDEVAKAGFVLVEEGTFLRNPNDTRDWNDSPRAAAERRGTSDRFVLKLKKP